MDKEEKKVDILITEYSLAYNKVVYLDDQANKYISYILAFIGAIAAVLGLIINDSKNTDLFSLSLVISIGTLIIGLLIIMALYYTVQCFRLGGYIKHLEQEINLRFGYGLLNWETKVSPKYIHKDITAVLIYIVMSIVFCALLAAVFYASAHFIWPTWPVLAIFIFIIGVIELITGIVYLRKAFTVHETINCIFSEDKTDIEEQSIVINSPNVTEEKQTIKE